MGKMLNLLHIEDSEDDALLICRALKKEGYDLRVRRVDTPETLAAALEERSWDVALSDYAMPRLNGFAALEIVVQKSRNLPFIIVSGALGEERAVELLRSGAWDYIPKDNLTRLASAVERALNERELRRKKVAAERALRKERSLLKAIIDNIPVMLTRYDPNANMMYLNKAFESKIGWCSEDLTHIDLMEEMYPDPGYRAKALAHMQATETKWKEFSILTRSGSYLESRWSNLCLEDGTQIGIGIDITDEKRTEAALRNAQKMESIGNLAGGIAHDFNNILFPIIGMAEILLEDLPESSIEAANAMEIYRAGRRGRDLVKQILAFSRQTEHQMTPTCIQTVLKEVLTLSRSTIPTSIQLIEDIQRDCGMVRADPTQIHQIVMNLVTNAYHAVAPSGGRIRVALKETLQTEKCPVAGHLPPGNYATIVVNDNGHGISPGIIDKIFEPYFTTKSQGKGTGLGLSVVYGIVQEHGGEITVTSTEGQGTEFTVYLPQMSEACPQAAEVLPSSQNRGDETILLIDDEASITHLETLMLERAGYKVFSHTSSHAALEDFRSAPERFDLVITDMTMPGMTGDQLAVSLMEIRPGIPVIICTGFSERVDAERAESIGVKGLLMKPVIKSDLIEMVRKVIDDSKTTATQKKDQRPDLRSFRPAPKV